MANNDTAALVVALSAQLSRFERDMKQAGDVADRTASGIEDRFSRLNPHISSSFLGNLFSNAVTAGISAAEDALKDLVKRFEDLQYTAKYTETAIQTVYGLQDAFKKSGSSVDDLNKSLTSVALQLDQMQRGNTENPLAKLFAANPQALKGIKIDALDATEALAKVGDIIQTLKPIERLEVARALGLPESAVQALERGGVALKAMANDAARAAPDIEKIAVQAKLLGDVLEGWGKAFKDEAITGFFYQFRGDLELIKGVLEGILPLLKEFGSGQWVQGAIDGLNEAEKKIKDAQSGATTFADRFNAVNDPRAKQRIRVTPDYSGVDPFGLNSKKAADPQDAFDRAEESILKRTAAIQADTIAVAQNNAVQAQVRAELELLNGIRKADGEVTQDKIDAYVKLRESMSAEQALTRAGINLTNEHAEAFRRDSENIGLATAQFDKARDGVNKLNSASSQVGSALSNAFADAVVEGKNLNDVLSNLLKTLEKAAINSLFSSFFNAPSSGGLSPFASTLKSFIPGFAEGTDGAPGGLAWVGEKGPELVNLPRGAQVIPSSVATRGGRPVSIGGPTIVVNGNMNDDAMRRIQQVLKQHERSIAGIGKSLSSSARFQTTGVS